MAELGLVHDAMRHYYRGRVFESTGEIDIAIEEYEKAIELGADYADIFNSLGRAYARKGHFDRALSAFQTSLKKNPHYLEAQRNLTELQARLSLMQREQILSKRGSGNGDVGLKLAQAMNVRLIAGIIGVAVVFVLSVLFLNRLFPKPKVQAFMAPSENISSVVSEGKNVWLCDWEKQEIYKAAVKGEDLTTENVYKFKDTFPVGLADGGNVLWSCDSLSMKINKHMYDKELSVTGSYSMNGLNIGFLCFDGNHLWSIDLNSKKIYRHNMSDPQMGTDFSFASQCKKPLGFFFDGRDYWSFDAENNYLFRYGKNFTVEKKYPVYIPSNKINAVFLDKKYLWLVFAENSQINRYPRKMFIK